MTSAYLRSYRLNYRVTIDNAVANPDTFKWEYSLDASSWTVGATGQLVTTTSTNLSNGVKINFNTINGHTLNDKWQFIAFSQQPQATVQINPPGFSEVLVKTNLGVESYIDNTYNANSTDLSAPWLALTNGTNTAIYMGLKTPWNVTYINIATAAVGCVSVFEYWSGGSWSNITTNTAIYSDMTSNFTVSGEIAMDSSLMTNWASTNLTVDTYTNLYYWARIRSTNAITSPLTLNNITIHGKYRLLVYGTQGESPTNALFSIAADGNIGVRNQIINVNSISNWNTINASYIVTNDFAFTNGITSTNVSMQLSLNNWDVSNFKFFVPDTNLNTFSKNITATFYTHSSRQPQTRASQFDFGTVMVTNRFAIIPSATSTNIFVNDNTDFAINDLIYVQGLTDEYAVVSAFIGTTGMVVSSALTNRHPVLGGTTVVARVNEISGISVQDDTGSSNMWLNLSCTNAPTTSRTNLNVRIIMKYTR
jgi:hypothetical protein